MAISQDLWLKAKEYFEAGLSLTDIVDRTGISKSQISKKATKENWEKGNEKKQLISQAVALEQKKKQFNETALQIHNEIVDEKLRRETLIYNATEKAVIKATDMLDYIDDASDLKSIIDGLDKASLTLGVNQRHSNSQVNIQNTNAQQTNIPIQIEWE